MDKVIRAGIYIRVSTEEQAKHGYSIDSQRCRLTDWCNDHLWADEPRSALHSRPRDHGRTSC